MRLGLALGDLAHDPARLGQIEGVAGPDKQLEPGPSLAPLIPKKKQFEPGPFNRIERLPRTLSFKHTLQLWIAWDRHGRGPHDEGSRYALFVLIAEQRVGNRPGHIEPRAIKRRPKPLPLLTQARDLARAKIRKQGHPRKVK